MLRLGPITILCTLWLATGIGGIAQTAAGRTVDERLQRADKLQDEGALTEAREIYEAVLKALPSDPPSRQLGHVLNGLSNVSLSLGDYEKSVDFADRADKVYRQLGDAEGEAYSLNNRGIAEGELGRYPRAQESLRQALALIRQTGGRETEVRTLNNLGNAFYFPGQYLEALRAYQEAWEVLEANSGEKWSDYWRQITRFNEATLYQRLGRYESALEVYKEVERSKGLSASDRGHLFTNLGVLYRRLGDSWKALDAYRAALALYARQSDAVGEISTLKNIGIVYALDQGELPQAHKFFEQALARSQQTRNQREVMQAHLYLGEAEFRGGKTDDSRRAFTLALDQARRLKTTEEQWKALYGLGRLEEMSGHLELAERDYRDAVGIIETTRTQLQLSALRTEFLADKRDVYDALIALLLKQNNIADTFLFLERSRARTFQDRLASAAADRQPAAASSPLSLDEVRGYLDASTILMEYWVADNQLALLWCTHESCGMASTQLLRSEKEELLTYLRGLPGNLGTDWRERSMILARLIPDGVSLPSQIHHALIVPDGWLSSVPFDLIPVGSSDTRLIERFDISYLPTAALLRRHPVIRSRPYLPWDRELMAFGDPDLQSRPEDSGAFERQIALQPLPYSAEEIRSIARMVPGRTESFLGQSDVKSTFLTAEFRGVPILHVSTHAFADADVPENSRILFSFDGSGAPGYLFLRELYELDLRGVNLATLSACDTERGRMIRGEGVQAFSRALLYAGSRSSLTTLWRVADQPTSEFMKQFYYFAVQKHQSKAEALRSAKLKFLRSGTELGNPAHWAAFVLTGDGINPLPRFFSWTELAAFLAIVIGAAVSGIWLLLRVRQRVHGLNRSQDVVS